VSEHAFVSVSSYWRLTLFQATVQLKDGSRYYQQRCFPYNVIQNKRYILLNTLCCQLTGHKNQCAADHGNELHARYHGSCILVDFLLWPHTSLYIDQTWHAVGLYWAPGHARVQGNKITDELTRGGSALKFVGPEPALGVARQDIRRTRRGLVNQHWTWLRGLGNTQKTGLRINFGTLSWCQG
jgi:hypothetical protein